jgi:hypothetical protein
MKHIAGALLVFAWLVTTDQIVEIKAIDTTTFKVNYKAYCTTQKTVKPEANGRYKLTIGAETIYVPAVGSIVESVTKCQ